MSLERSHRGMILGALEPFTAGVMESKQNGNSNNRSVLRANQCPDDCLEVFKGTDFYGSWNAYEQLFICYLPIRCMAQSVLRYTFFISEMFLSRLLTSLQSPIAIG